LIKNYSRLIQGLQMHAPASVLDPSLDTSTLVLSLGATLFFTGGSERAGTSRAKCVGQHKGLPV
jgi:hypothetical protein